MKLAEALILRADSQKRIEQIKQRLLRNAKVQDGDEPAEKPAELLQELERTAQELVQLIQRINRTNSATVFAENDTLSDVLAKRDILQLRHGIYSELAKAATVSQDRYSRSEVKFKSTVAVDEIQKMADRLAKEHRELDAGIQERNWKTDLLA
jgi:hypothetical protein